MSVYADVAYAAYLASLRDEGALCDECGQRRGDIQCDECGDQFCDGCIDHHSEEAHRRYSDETDE